MATQDYPFANAPSTSTQIIGNYTVTYQSHHVVSNQAFDGSSFMQALAAKGLWSQNDFRLNGLDLPATINGNNVNYVSGRETIVGGSLAHWRPHELQ